MGQGIDLQACLRPLESVVRLLGRKWTILLILLLGRYDRNLRYSEIKAQLDRTNEREISDSTLSKKLFELCNLGLVTRRSYDEVPPHVEYELTETGLGLVEILNNLTEWSCEHCHNGGLKISKTPSES